MNDATAATIAATALAASEVWRLRTGRAQSVAVDARAAVAVFRSEPAGSTASAAWPA